MLTLNLRQTGYVLDPLVNIYDLRTFRSLPPVPFPAGAAFCRMHPKMSTTGIVASQTGQFQIIDIANPNVVNLRQANISNYLSSLELAPTGDALALADADSILQLWGKPDKIKFTEISNPVEWASVPSQTPAVEFNEHTPLSSVGMPYYREQLLSAWPSHLIYEVGKPLPKIDPEILGKMKMHDFVGYAPNPRRTRRYQVESSKAQDKPGQVQAPKFRSEKARDGRADDHADNEAPWSALAGSELRPFDVPAMYHKVEIKYSRFGVDDFDFE